MPNDTTPQGQLNPGYGTELLLVTVGGVLLIVALVAIAATSIALIVLAIVATSALAAAIAALVLRMTSDPAKDRALPSPAPHPKRAGAAQPRSRPRPIHLDARRGSHTHARARAGTKTPPGSAGGISSKLAYALALYDNQPALAKEAQRQRDEAQRRR
jgi:apolipoprotein N-acyltransferase